MAAKLTNLDEWNTLLAQCGCCEMPRCCPPLIECQSGHGWAQPVGFIDYGSDSSDETDLWKKPRYLRFVRTRHGESIPDTIRDFPSGGGHYSSGGTTASWEIRFIDEYVSPFESAISGAYFAGDCKEGGSRESNSRCDYSGGWVTSGKGIYEDGAGWHSYENSREVAVISDASGEVRQGWTAWHDDAESWDTAHPDFATELADWEADHTAWETEEAEWTTAWDAWDAGGQVGEEPTLRTEPEEPGDRPEEPDKFYPPCTMRTTVTVTRWHYSAGEVKLYPDTEEEPNPYTYEIVPGGLQGQGPAEPVESYENKITYEEFLTAANAWLSPLSNFDYAEGSDSSGCEPGALCRATRSVDPFEDAARLTTDFFRYRVKLNKCCGYPKIRSEWDNVLYPREWLNWLAEWLADEASDSVPAPAEPAARPLVTPKAWEWEGVPPMCDDSSGSDSSADPVDPFDHEPMWSPWSPVIQVPEDMEGVVAMRNYQQKCYGVLPDPMPGVFGGYDESETPTTRP